MKNTNFQENKKFDQQRIRERVRKSIASKASEKVKIVLTRPKNFPQRPSSPNYARYDHLALTDDYAKRAIMRS